MAAKSFKFMQQAGRTIPYTAGGAVNDGDVVVVGRIVGVARTNGPAAASGDKLAVEIDGVHKIEKAAHTIDLGAAVFWNSTGNPYGGTAGSGAVQNAGGTFCGFQVSAAATGTDTHAIVSLQQNVADS